MEVIDIDALANAVRERAAGEPLDRIEAAMAVSEDLASGADDLIGQFVAEARQAGRSWTEIGQRIGVSKQAARQRFAQARPEKARRRRRGKAGNQCSFCGKPGSSELRLIAGPGVYICAECVGLCNEILAGEAATAGSAP